MNRETLNQKIAEAAKIIRSYSLSRTSNAADAEDLSQEILLEVCKSADNLRSDSAFYGFMWSIAGNVCKQWYRRKERNRFCELTEDIPCPERDDESEEIHLLRRELGLLNQKYRKAVVLYYMENKSCAQIASILSVSESMVKYLLFKSRQILKEGMMMERKSGQQSYQPKELMLQFWGHGPNACFHLCDSRISQNILFACYHDKLTAEEIALEIGIALPYMEDKLDELYEGGLLNREGKRYSANIAIFTKEFQQEVRVKTSELKKRIAELAAKAVAEYEDSIRSIPFAGADMGDLSFAWQVTCRLLYSAVIENLQSRVQLHYPQERYGNNCFVWGIETDEQDLEMKRFNFGVSNAQNKEGDYVQFMDFPINGEMVHFFFAYHQSAVNVFLDIARGRTEHFSENDLALAAEMIKHGYVVKENGGLRVNTPVFSSAQHRQVKEVLAETAARMADEAERLIQTVTEILKNYLPVHLKKQAPDLAYLRLFDDAVCAPAAALFEQHQLHQYQGEGMLPTTYVILK